MHFALRRADGGVSIMDIADPTKLDRSIAKWSIKHGAPLAVRQIDPATLPERTFRGAWTDDGVAIGHNMAKARLIHMDRIRLARNAELEKLDKIIATNEDAGGRDAANRAKRQTLRDIPQTFDLSGAATADELKALWPAAVPR